MPSLQKEFIKKLKEKYGESIFKENFVTNKFYKINRDNLGMQNNQIAITRRNSEYYKQLCGLPCSIVDSFSAPNVHPIFFEQFFIRDFPRQIQIFSKGVHLYVFVHGFQGNNQDLRIFRNVTNLVYPEIELLCSTSNENDTEGDINEMGIRLAQEIKLFLNEKFSHQQLAKISFIGHSMGGLIIRAALPYLEEYQSKMYTYISLSTPHLGYSYYATNKLINAGIWFLKKWKNVQSLKQISMTDSRNQQDCFLYKLSETQGLE